jgi:hypothetical protein
LTASFSAVDGGSAVGGIFQQLTAFSSAVDGSFRQLAGAGRKFLKISKSPSCPLHGRAVGSIFVWDAAQFDICHTKVVKMKTFFRN